MIESKRDPRVKTASVERSSQKKRRIPVSPAAASQTSVETQETATNGKNETPDTERYIESFISNWEKRQEQYPLHEAAKNKAEQDWQNEQTQARAAARQQHTRG
jgi:hypothetical protein